MTNIDHAQLLQKYLRYVTLAEGTNYIGALWQQRDANEVGITDAERVELERLNQGEPFLA